MPGGASVSSWHRQQHKKQQQKNKTERIAARDKALEWLQATKSDDDPQSVAMRLVLYKQLGRRDQPRLPLTIAKGG